VIVTLDLNIQAKDGGALPTPAQVAMLVSDVLVDVTKHDSETGWRVAGSVTIHQPGACVS
jgi:hypothetical protein